MKALNNIFKILMFVSVVGLALSLTACSGELTPPLVFKTDYTIFQAAGTKRVYLMHGFRSSRHQYDIEPFKSFVDDLVAQGIEVVTFDTPYAYREYFLMDGGANYRKMYKEQLETIVADVEANYGVKRSFSGGFSFGGLHAMMANVLLPNKFEAFFAALPVTDISALKEMKNVNAHQFNPLLEDMSQLTGMVSWGTNDERVNYRLSIDLVNNNSNLIGIEYAGLEHESTLQVTGDAANFIGGL